MRKAAQAAQEADIAHLWAEDGLSRAERVVAFCESLPVTKGYGAGEPVALLPFQREWIEAIYQDNEDGTRTVRTAVMSVARGNGKSVLAAMLCLAHLVGPESEARGECYSAAATQAQASLIFAEMEAIILATPWMAARLNVRRFHKTIEDLETGSTYRALASDGPSLHGLAASFIVCDELAQWKRRELFDVLRTSMGKRAQPLLLAIGTQSPSPENIMSELIDYSAKVASGEVVDRTFHGVCHEIPEGLDPFEPDNWQLANPALGVFRSLSEMRDEAERAQRMPTFRPAFLNLYCNQRVDSEAKAFNPAEWALCGDPVDPESLRGRPCYGGLDLSSTRDLTALVLYFPEDGGAVLPWFWCPKDNLAERAELDRVPYPTWADQGLIEATPGKAIDRRHILFRLLDVLERFDVRGIAFDRWRIEDLKTLAAADGVTLPLEPWGQGFATMSGAIDALEAAMLSGNLRHGNHPILRWHASNAVFETDPAGNRKLSKNRSAERIDGVQALAMAIGLAGRAEQPAVFSGGLEWV